MALKTPQLADLDDPLAGGPAHSSPAPATPPPTPPASPQSQPAQRRARPPRPPAAAPQPAGSFAGQPRVAIFARVPERLSDGVAAAVAAVNAARSRPERVSQQDVIGAVLERYVTSEHGLDAAELGALADAYRRRLLPDTPR